MSLLRSGIFWAVLAFLGSLGNFAFQILIAHHFKAGEYGAAGAVLNFTVFLSLPLASIATAVIHYVSHFRSHNDEGRLQGLLAGCQKFLRNATIGGSILALLLAIPLGSFFNFRPGLILAAVVCVLTGLWSGFAIALCQGMAWFKRLAIVGFIGVLLRLLFGYFVALPANTAEMAVSATTFSLLANLALLYWWKDIVKKDVARISPWNREFLNFVIVTTALVGANWFFTQGDLLAAAHNHFPKAVLGLYVAAGQLGRAVPQSVGPLLQVMFTSRSGKRTAQAATDQRVLLLFYAAGLGLAALCLIVMREFCVRVIFGKYNPESAAMVPRLAGTMVFAGLNQAIATWCLASRWFKITLLYGALGAAFWLALLLQGTNPNALLTTMLIGSSVSFAILCAAWLNASRQKPVAVS